MLFKALLGILAVLGLNTPPPLPININLQKVNFEFATTSVQIDEPKEETQSTALATTTDELELGGEQGGDNELTIKKEEIKESIRHGKQKPYSCVTWARAHSKVGQPPKVKYAKELTALYFSPRVDSWIIFGEGYFGNAGHTGIIEAVNRNLITFRGFNFPYGEERVMIIDITDPKYNVLGYWDNRI